MAYRRRFRRWPAVERVHDSLRCFWDWQVRDRLSCWGLASWEGEMPTTWLHINWGGPWTAWPYKRSQDGILYESWSDVAPGGSQPAEWVVLHTDGGPS